MLLLNTCLMVSIQSTVAFLFSVAVPSNLNSFNSCWFANLHNLLNNLVGLFSCFLVLFFFIFFLFLPSLEDELVKDD